MFQTCVYISACIFLCFYEYIHRVCVYKWAYCWVKNPTQNNLPTLFFSSPLRQCKKKKIWAFTWRCNWGISYDISLQNCISLKHRKYSNSANLLEEGSVASNSNNGIRDIKAEYDIPPLRHHRTHTIQKDDSENWGIKLQELEEQLTIHINKL